MRTGVGARTATLAGFCLLALVAGCSTPANVDQDSGYEPIDVVRVDAEPDSVPSACIDQDHDGFGTNCRAGADCNDNDPTITDQCYRCAQPATGCPCTAAQEGIRLPCDATTDTTLAGPDGTCHLGARTCTNGTWSHCQALDQRQIISGPMPCPGLCDPTCQMDYGCPTSTADLSGGSTGVVIGTAPPSVWCPTGTPPGGITLQQTNGTSTTGGTCTPCGTICCGAPTTCYSSMTTQGSTASSPRNMVACTYQGNMAPTIPPSAYTQSCGIACTAPQFHCGDPPLDQCCDPTQTCQRGGCRTPGGGCHSNADCGPDQICDTHMGTCETASNTTCDCSGNTARQGCLNSVTAQGGQVINDIFSTNSGQDARQLQFAHYVYGQEANPTTTPIGRSNPSGTNPFSCSSTACDPTDCSKYVSFNAAHDYATIQPFSDALDWQWIEIDRYNPTTNVIDANPSTGDYDPRYGAVYDLGFEANQVAIFSIRDSSSTGDSCIQAWEFSVWATDNPYSTQQAGNTVDPTKWNYLTLRRIFTDGWTLNPTAMGNPSDTSDLRSSTTGPAIGDGATTVWVLPCGSNMRYVSIQPGNQGNPTGSCHYGSSINRIDAVAGLDEFGNGPSITHILPYGTQAGPDLITGEPQANADVYFLFDTTQSMSASLPNLVNAFGASGDFAISCPGGVAAGVRCMIPDSWFGVGTLQDFPVTPYGQQGNDVIYSNLQVETSDLTSVQSTMLGLSASGVDTGLGDRPEGDVPALWAVATGNGLQALTVMGTGTGLTGSSYNYLAPSPGCTNGGSLGYPCFRSGSSPVVVLVSDAVAHNGAGGTNPYDDNIVFGSGATTYPASTTAQAGSDVASAASPSTLSTSSPIYISGSNSNPFANDTSGSCGGSNGRDVAYVFTLAGTRRVHIDTSGTGAGTTPVLYVRSGTALTSPEVAGGCATNGTSSVSLDLTLGAGTYALWVDATSGGASGAFDLHFSTTAPPANSTPTFAQAITALSAIGARVITVNASGGTNNDLLALSTQSGAVDPSGSTYSFNVDTAGDNLLTTLINGRNVAQAINRLARAYSTEDVYAIAVDNPTTSVNESQFVLNPVYTTATTASIRLSDTARGEPAPYPAGDCTGTTPSPVAVRALGCIAGTPVNFEAEWVNNIVPPLHVQQTFTFNIEIHGVHGTTDTVLETIPVTIIVPAASYPPSGSATFNIVSPTCQAGYSYVWNQLQFDVDTPNGTSIGMTAQTSLTAAGLPTAPVVNLGTTPPTLSPIDLSAALIAGGQSNNLPYLQITFTLNSDPTNSYTPTLRGYNVVGACLPTQ